MLKRGIIIFPKVPLINTKIFCYLIYLTPFSYIDIYTVYQYIIYAPGLFFFKIMLQIFLVLQRKPPLFVLSSNNTIIIK